VFALSADKPTIFSFNPNFVRMSIILPVIESELLPGKFENSSTLFFIPTSGKNNGQQ